MKAAISFLALTSCFLPIVSLAQTTKDPIKAKVVKNELVSPSLYIAKPGAAPAIPLSSIAFENLVWSNNLQDFVGRIVMVKIEQNGSATIMQVLNSIKADTVKNKLSVPQNPEEVYQLIDKSTTASISFMGINPSISNDERYEYKSNTMVISTVNDRQVDKNKVPGFVKCPDRATCQYFYVNAAALQTCESTHIIKKGKKLNVSDFPIGVSGVVIPINGNFFTGSSTTDRTKKNIVFCTLLAVPM